jgi:hypothetical protein
MNTTHVRSDFPPLRQKTLLWLVIAGLWVGVEVAQGQLAAVKGTITTDRGVRVPGATVHVIDHKSHNLVHDPGKAQGNGDYAIDDLRPGKYDFVACGLPYWPDEPKRESVKADKRTPINLLLIDAPFSSDPEETRPKMEIRFAGDADTDGFVYLQDDATRCVVAQQLRKPAGIYKFTRIDKPFHVCTRKRPDGENAEDYTCHAPTSSF